MWQTLITKTLMMPKTLDRDMFAQDASKNNSVVNFCLPNFDTSQIKDSGYGVGCDKWNKFFQVLERFLEFVTLTTSLRFDLKLDHHYSGTYQVVSL